MGVGDWFSTFCTDLRIAQEKRTSIGNRTARLVGQLNHDFRSLDSKTAYRFYVGSYGRRTAIPSVSDVDLLYELPAALYAKYNGYASNGQSALLGAVRDSLRNTPMKSQLLRLAAATTLIAASSGRPPRPPRASTSRSD